MWVQGGSDGSGRQSCKCNYVDITKMPGPHADTARVMPGPLADIAHTVCVGPGPHVDTVCVKPGSHADMGSLNNAKSNLKSKHFTMGNEQRQQTFPNQT